MTSRRKMIDEAIDTCLAASRIPKSELASRANAYRDIMAALGSAVTVLKAMNAVGNRTSSDKAASLASKIMSGLYKPTEAKSIPAGKYNSLLADAQSLAGSVVSQADGPEPETDADQIPLPIDSEGVSARALRDAQNHNQAAPLVRTVVAGPGSTGLDIKAPYGENPDGSPKDLEDLD